MMGLKRRDSGLYMIDKQEALKRRHVFILPNFRQVAAVRAIFLRHSLKMQPGGLSHVHLRLGCEYDS